MAFVKTIIFDEKDSNGESSGMFFAGGENDFLAEIWTPREHVAIDLSLEEFALFYAALTEYKEMIDD